MWRSRSKQRGPSLQTRYRWLWVYVLSLFMLGAQARFPSLLGLEENIRGRLAPVYRLLSAPARYYDNLQLDSGSKQELLQENTSLQQQVLTLQSHMQRFDALEYENHALKTLLHRYERYHPDTIVARLTPIYQHEASPSVWIDRGSLDGIHEGQPVVDALGLLGVIESVTERNAQVILLTDPRMVVPAALQRAHLQGLVHGNGFGQPLLMKHVPTTADVQKGDFVVTSGQGGRLPPNLRIGEVIQIQKTPNHEFFEVLVVPKSRLVHNIFVVVLAESQENAS
ncbi:MAG: rod shape-determining protein MreC [Pseudomonadota bacterium]